MIVYKLINKVNNKFYIGVTTNDLKTRLRGHRQKGNPHLQNAMKKYGKENFIIEQIDTAKTQAQLDKKEIQYIRKLKPHYNKASGGRLFFNHSEESKRKIGEGNMVAKLGNKYRLGKEHTETTKEKISESLKGHKKTNFGGYTLSDEFKEKCRIRMKKNNPATRPEVREKLRQAALRRYK